MHNALLLLVILSISLFAYSDSDLDGVEDDYDLCPQTHLSDLVDHRGCVIRSTNNRFQYDIIAGMGYSEVNAASQRPSNTVTASMEMNTYIGNWWLQGIVSHYNSKDDIASESGLDDTLIHLLYTITPTKQLMLTSGVGIVLATYKSDYNNEANDYTGIIEFQYDLNHQFYLFGGMNYTWVRDHNVIAQSYQNSAAFRLGAGYLGGKKSVWSAAYYQNESIYADIETIKSFGVGYSYQMDSNWFAGVDCGYGLSDAASKYTFAGRVGYSFR